MAEWSPKRQNKYYRLPKKKTIKLIHTNSQDNNYLIVSSQWELTEMFLGDDILIYV